MHRLVLLGGGHAHVQVVRAFAASVPRDATVTLVSPSRHAVYSGMLPGVIAGHYRIEQARIDLVASCRNARVTFIEDRACGIDPQSRCVALASGKRLNYDLLSIDTGSTTPVADIPGADLHAVPVKPVDGFLAAVERIIDRARRGELRSVAVIGGGPAGFEVTLALDHRLRSITAGAYPVQVHLYADSPSVLPSLPASARRRGERILVCRHVVLHSGSRVTEIDADGIRLAQGRHDAQDAVFLATGAMPARMFRSCGLRTDEHGFIAVGRTLQSVSHPDVFASGDAAAMVDDPRPKAGVFAVRQGPVLADNLRRALQLQPLRDFVPQREFLVLLGTGTRHAIAVRNGWSMQGRWAWHWKDWIDRRFMAGFANG